MFSSPTPLPWQGGSRIRSQLLLIQASLQILLFLTSGTHAQAQTTRVSRTEVGASLRRDSRIWRSQGGRSVAHSQSVYYNGFKCPTDFGRLQTGRLSYSHTLRRASVPVVSSAPGHLPQGSLRPAHHETGRQTTSLSPDLCLSGDLAGLLLAADSLPRCRRPLGNRGPAPGLQALDHGVRPREQVGSTPVSVEEEAAADGTAITGKA